MNNKKKLKIAGASALGVGVLGLGAFAFFSDVAELELGSKVGDVSITTDANIKHTQLKRDVLAQLMYPEIKPENLLKEKALADPNAQRLFEALQEFQAMMEDENANLSEMETLKTEIDSLIETVFFEEAPNNINPGDNVPSNARPGTDHEIEIEFSNTGTKSVATRIVVELSGTSIDGEPLSRDELRDGLKVGLDSDNTISGITSVGGGADGIIPLEHVDSHKENVAKFIIGADIDYPSAGINWAAPELGPVRNNLPEVILSNFVLSGSEEIEKYVVNEYSEDEGDYVRVTKEAPKSGSFKLDLAMNSNSGHLEPSKIGAPIKGEILEGAEIKVKVKVEALQYRNTQDSDWETIFEEQFDM